MLSVAFYTLFERKVIGLSQLRVGPNKVSFTNLVQPLLDAFKLIIKQPVTPVRANNFIYSLSPIIALFLAIVV
jgi:NADH:ubiquinone oxidoreductase subunit H